MTGGRQLSTVRCWTCRAEGQQCWLSTRLGDRQDQLLELCHRISPRCIPKVRRGKLTAAEICLHLRPQRHDCFVASGSSRCAMRQSGRHMLSYALKFALPSAGFEHLLPSFNHTAIRAPLDAPEGFHAFSRPNSGNHAQVCLASLCFDSKLNCFSSNSAGSTPGC